MKRSLLFFLSLFCIITSANVYAQDQDRWSAIPASYRNDQRFVVDDAGKVYRLYADWDGGGYSLYVDRFEVFSGGSWSNIYKEPATSPGKIFIDKKNGVTYFSIMMDESGKLLHVYKLENGVVSLVLNDFVSDYESFTDYAFQVGDNPGEFYWFMNKMSTLEPLFVTYTTSCISFLLDDLTGLAPMDDKLLMQQVGDTLWLGCGETEMELHLFKTHKTNIDFLPADTDPTGMIYDLSAFRIDEAFLLSDRVSKLSVISQDAVNNLRTEMIFNNGSPDLKGTFPDYLIHEGAVATSDAGDKAYFYTNFAATADPNGYRSSKLLALDYNTNSWDTIGSVGQNFVVNYPSVSRFSMSASDASKRIVTGCYNDGNYVVRVLNDKPDRNSVIATENTVLCSDASLSLYSEFSVEDLNNDSLKINDISSSDQTVTGDNDLYFSTINKIGNRTYFDIQAYAHKPGTTQLTIEISDSYDTIEYKIDVTFVDYSFSTITSADICGDDVATLSAVLPGGGTIDWYETMEDVGDAPAIYSGSSYTTGINTESDTLYIQGTFGDCETNAEPIYVHYHVPPTVATTMDANSCGSSVATVSATASSGDIYWFPLAAGGALLGSGDNYTTPLLADTTIYYAEAIDGVCGSTRVAVYANITPWPLFSSIYDASTCGTGSVQLSAATVDGGNTIEWFDTIVVGTPVGTGAIFNTPSLTATDTFYVRATDASGCYSQRFPVVATVLAPPTFTVKNDGARCGTGTVNLSATASSGTIKWYTAASGGTPIATGTSFTTPVISATTKYYIEIEDGLCTTQRDSVTATVNIIPSVTSTTPAASCGTGSIALGATASAGTLSWFAGSSGGPSLGTGTTYNTPSISTTTAYYVETSDGTCTSPRSAVVATISTDPTITGTSPSTVCGASAVTLGATASAGTISWFAASSGGTSLGTGTSFTTPVITSTTTYYVETTVGTCTSARTAVTATINTIPTITTTTPAANCGTGSVTLGATASSGTLDWFAASSGGPSLGTGTTFNTPSISSTTTYYVETSNGTCTSPRSAVVATINTAPTITGTTPAAICGTGAVTIGATASAGTISWYAASSGGTSLGTGASFTSPVITATTTYYAETTAGACTSSPRVAVVATINTIPSVTSTTPAANCGTGVVTLGATASSGTLDWYVASSGGASLGTGTTYNTPSISSTTTYYVETSNGTCTSPRSAVVATINTQPTITGTTPTAICGTGSVTIGATASAGTISWYAASSGGTSLGTGASFTSPVITSTTTYYAETTVGACTSARSAIVATINTIPSVTSTTPAANCGTGSVTLGATASSGTLDWFAASSGGPSLGTGTTYNTPSISSTTTYYVETSNGTCTSPRSAVVATINTSPTITGTTPATICGTGAVTIGATASAGTISWFAASSGGTSLGTGASFTSPVITSTTTYYAETTVGACTSARSAVVATINTIPSVTSTTPAANCGTGSLTLGATASSGTLDWYATSSGGPSLGTGTSYNTPSISSTTTYYVETSNGTCTSPRSAVVATINTQPTITGTIPAAICGTGAVTIGATASAGTISWFAASSGGTSLGTGTSFTSPVITATTTYYAETTVGACTSSPRVAVVATINTIPSVTSTTPASNCGTGSVTLGATASSGTLDWFAASSGGPSLGTGTTYNTPSISSTTTYYVETSDGTCTSPRSAVVATINTQPTITGTTPAAICGTGAVTIGATASAGTISWFTASSGGTSLGTGTSFTSPVITSTTTYYAETTVGACTSSPRVAVIATINTIPSVTSTTPAANCGTGSVALGATASSGTLDWYAASSGGPSLGTGTTFNTPSISSTTTYYVETSNGTCTSPRSAVVATINTQPTITGTTPAAICGTGAVTIGATASAGTISWFTASSGGTSLGTGASFTSPVITATTTYYAETTVGACTSSPRVAVVATINTIPSVTSTTPAANCGTGSVTLGATASTGTLSWFAASSGGPSLGTGTTYNTPSISSTTTYYVETSNGTCTSPRSAVVATINTAPTITGTTPAAICGTGAVTIGATASAGTISWYAAASGGTSLGTGASFTSPVITSTTTYYAETTVGACTSSPRVAVVATINTIPSVTSTTPAANCGTGVVTLGATASSGTLDWYAASSGGASLGTGTTYNTPSISSTTTYYVETSNGTCTSPRSAVVATINTAPTITGTTPAAICGTGAVTIGATASAGTISWFTASSGGTSLGTGTSFTSPVITATTTYYVETTAGACSSSPRVAVVATINTIPSVTSTTPAAKCGTGSVTLGATASTGTLSWFAASSGGPSLGTGTTFNTPSISSTTTYYVETSNGTCTSPRSAVVATINTQPTITGTTPAAICGTGAVTIGATASAGTISWFTASSGGTSLGTGASFTSPVITATTTYYAETTVGACTSSPRVAVVATINTIPSVTSTTPAANCGTGSVTLGATASTGTLSWFAASSGGPSLGTGTTYNTPSISSTTTYYVETSNGTCTSPRSAVVATINTAPTITGTTPAAICGTGAVTIGATASAGTISWYAASSGGTSLGTGTSFTSPVITATTTYYAETTVGACTSSPRVAVVATINTIPSVTSTTPASNCGTGVVTLGATASSGTLDWYAASSGGPSLGTGTSYNTPSISSTTTYYVETSNGTCTSPRSAVVATINTLPNVAANTDGAICVGNSFALSASGANSYSWNNGVGLGANKTVSPIATTTYIVTGTALNGCQNTDAVTVTVNSLPAVDAGSDAVICNNDAITLSGSGAVSYSWDNGVADGVSFNPSSTITYLVTGTDANGCQNTDDVVVTVNALPTVNAGTDITVCENTAIALSGSGANSYTWNNGVTNGVSFTPLATTTYTVTGTNTNGCVNTDQVTVTVNTLPMVSAGSDAVICENDAITLNGSGAVSYTWNNGISNAVSFNPDATATYTVSGTDANGCINTDQVIVTVHALPAVDAGSDVALCAATSITLNGSGAVSYSWDNGVTDGVSFNPSSTATYTVTGTDANGCINTDQVTVSVNSAVTVDAGTDFSICENELITLSGSGAVSYSWDNGVTDGVSFAAVTTTTYTVTGTDANGCISTDQITVTVNTLPSVSAGSDAAICENDAITLSGSGAAGYNWDNGVADGVSFSPAATTTYTVSGTDANGCTASDQVTITVNALPAVDAGSDVALCTSASVTLSGAGAVSYSWDNGVTDGVSFNPSSSATYTVTGTDANGCINTDQVDVTVNAIAAVDAGSDFSICENGTVTLFGSGAASYSWDNGVTDGVSFTPLATTTYTVTGTDANGCTGTDQITVSVNALPTVSAGSDLAVCENDQVTLSGGGAVNYSWDNGVTDGISFNPTATTTYTVTGTDANGCQDTDQLIVTVNALPAVDAGSDAAICANDAIILAGSGAVSYSWDNGITDGIAFNPATTATYTVTGTDANGCINTDAVIVTVNTLPAVSAGPDLTLCENGSVTLSGSGAVNYSWDNGVTNGVAFSPSATATYTVTGTDANGCVNTDQATVSINSAPTVNSASPIEICKAEELTLTASSTASIIKWFDQPVGGTLLGEGNTLVISDVLANSTVYVEAFENGCTSVRAQVDILVNDKPVIAVSSTNSDCGSNNGTASASISQGTAPYFYYWSEGTQNQFNISGLPTGAYYFNVEDAKGCKAMAVTEVNPSAIQMNPTVINPSCFGVASGSISLNISGVSESIHYLWNTGHQTSSISSLNAGTYEVTVTTESGCVLSSSFVLTQPSAIVNTLLETKPSCGDNDGKITVQSTAGGNGPYLYSWSNGQFGLNNNNLTYGAYTLTTTDQAGCQVFNTVFLPEENAPIVEGVVTQTACDGSTGTIDLDITPVNGDPIASVVWSNGAETEDLSGLAAGNYVSFITSQNNCVSVNAWSINVVQPNVQEICIVTVDSVTTTNLVVWEKSQLDGISHYNIYRESNQIDDYQLIDTVRFTNQSIFNDVIASPLARSWRYKIAAVNFCGVEGPMSSHHKTLHLNTFDMGGSGVKITWDGYEGTAFSNYVLWRYTDEFGWEDVATLGTGTLTYTDPVAFTTAGLDYMVEIALDVPCTANVWRAQDFNRSRSNKERGLFRPGEGTGDSNNEVVEFEDGNISLNVYPNPFSNNVTLNLSGTHSMHIQLFDIQGKLILENVYSEGENTVDLSNLGDGVYFIKTMINNESKTIKITKN